MVQRLLDDNRAMAERQRAAIETCDDHHDTPTGNLLQDILDQTERRVWFLFEVSQTGEPSSESEESRASQSRGADAEGPEPRGSESRRPTSRASEPRSSGSRATPRNRPPGGRSGRR